MSTPQTEYPIQVTAEVPEASNRLLALTGILFLKGIILLPHLIVLVLIQIAMIVVAWIGYWAILFTGRIPPGMHSFITGYHRWYTRAYGWLLSLTDKYPPFTLGGDSLGRPTTPAQS